MASTVQPHAETCPIFTGPENYQCATYGTDQRPKGGETFALSIKPGTVAGVPSYEVRTPLGVRTLVIGQSQEQTVDGKVVVSTASCGKIKGSKGELDAIILRTQVKGGAMTSETYFYPQAGGIVRMQFGPTGPDGGLLSKNVCRPQFPSRKAQPPANSAPNSPAGRVDAGTPPSGSSPARPPAR